MSIPAYDAWLMAGFCGVPDDGPDEPIIIHNLDEPSGAWQAPGPPPERCPADDDPRDTDAMEEEAARLEDEIHERVGRWNKLMWELDQPRQMEVRLR